MDQTGRYCTTFGIQKITGGLSQMAEKEEFGFIRG